MSRFHYLPFSIGERGCIAQQFALLEMVPLCLSSCYHVYIFSHAMKIGCYTDNDYTMSLICNDTSTVVCGSLTLPHSHYCIHSVLVSNSDRMQAIDYDSTPSSYDYEC
jgi:hypothetical protein